MAGQARGMVVLGLLGAAFVLGLLGLVLEWWEVEVSQGEITRDFFSAGPYGATFSGFDDEGDSPSAMDDVLQTHTVLTGVFLTLGLAAIAGAGVVMVVSMLRFPLPTGLALGLAGAAALIGLIFTVLAALVWPGAWESETDAALTSLDADEEGEFARIISASWWGTHEVVGQSVTLHFSPSAGWFLAIIGYVILPVAAIAASRVPWGILVRDAPPPRAQYLPPPTAPPPPPLPIHPEHRPPTTSAAGGQGNRGSPPGKRRRLSVVSKKKAPNQNR